MQKQKKELKWGVVCAKMNSMEVEDYGERCKVSFIENF